MLSGAWMSEGEGSGLEKALKELRRRLVDTGTRNPLIHVNRANARANRLNIINERSDEVYAILRGGGAGSKMRFLATGKDKDADSEDLHLAALPVEAGDPSSRLTDRFLETPLGPEAQARRLLKLATDARTAEEEQGVNILYLAMGFLRWLEDANSRVVREAPLILLPVELVRNERTSTYDIRCRDDDLSTNLPLQQRMRTDFGITFPEVEETEGWTPSAYFSQVQDIIAARSGWSIDPDGMQLGFFSFAKLLMYRDLDPANWPENSLSGNPLLRGLLLDGFEEDKPLFEKDAKLDEILDPADIIQVIDADASQTAVIEEVRKGSSLVVQGPPGTGKSQTITNLIAAAAHDGKAVLFVAEKMAALSVVHNRLVRAGLSDIALELHSRAANKKLVAQQIDRTLKACDHVLPAVPSPSELRVTRNDLNKIAAMLHEPLEPTGDAPFSALSEIVGFIGKQTPPPQIALEGLERLGREARETAQKALGGLIAARERTGPPEAHPFFGARAIDLQPTDLSRLEAELREAIAAMQGLEQETVAIATTLGVDPPASLSSIPDLLEQLARIAPIPHGATAHVDNIFAHARDRELATALAAGIAWREARTAAEQKFKPAAFEIDVEALEQGIHLGRTLTLAGVRIDATESLRDVKSAQDAVQSLSTDAAATAQAFGLDEPSSFSGVEALCATLEWLTEKPPRAADWVPVLSGVPDRQRLIESLKSGLDLVESRQATQAQFDSAVSYVDAVELRRAIARGQASFWSRHFGGYKRASAELAALLSVPLPPDPQGRLELADQLVTLAKRQERFAADERWLQDVLQGEWRAERTPFGALLAVATWLGDQRGAGRFSSGEKLLEALADDHATHQQRLTLLQRAQACKSLILALAQGPVGDGAPDLAGALRQVSMSGVLDELRSLGAYAIASTELGNLLLEPSLHPPGEREALVAELVEVRRLRQRLAESDAMMGRALKTSWQGENTPFGEVQATARWIAALSASSPFSTPGVLARTAGQHPDPLTTVEQIRALAQAAGSRVAAPLNRLQFDRSLLRWPDAIERVHFRQISDQLSALLLGLSRYGDWAELNICRETANAAGAETIVEWVLDGRLAPELAGAEFAYACAEARWKAARVARPELGTLQYVNRHERVDLFRRLEQERLESSKTLILENHFKQVPRGSAGEMKVIRGEIGRKKAHMPIRKLMKQAGGMMQRIKPVMLMSPISVAQFLPPGSLKFDLLVIDEASQIRPEDALGVVARAKQIVVVGDQKQLPPTSFFDRLVEDPDDNDDDEENTPVGAGAADMESILALCEARGLRQRMLEWHYRSRDPSLIRVSNKEFYGDGLVLPPSPLALDDDYGLKLRRVPGVYARGASSVSRQGTNRIEAEEVVKAIAQHAREWPHLSLGVVAFSKAQADMLTEVLEMHRRQDSVLDAFLREGKAEDVFVKNIENVQGDERDVVFISVGYGPREPNGRLAAQTFGPVNSEGGERRLNVLFSRARVRCEVFASFDPGDINPDGATRNGPRVLKRFLEFAKTGVLQDKEPTGKEPDSPFEIDVADVVRSLGYLADPQVGSVGFHVDIGVRHPDRPGQYIAAVECDGATYHRALWARERDRLRQSILEDLGWRFHRIWSTDWFHNKAREIERLKTALDDARRAAGLGIKVKGANASRAEGIRVPEREPPAASTSTTASASLPEVTVPAYRKAELSVQADVEPHEAPTGKLADLVIQIVELEGPVHIEEIARRITSAYGRSRAGSRIVEATRRAVRNAKKRDPNMLQFGEFLMTAAQAESSPVRSRSAETGSLTKAIYLPPVEIAAAARMALEHNGAMAKDELVRAVSRILGFQRLGTELMEAISKGITQTE